jgi:ferric enterobactin receptor
MHYIRTILLPVLFLLPFFLSAQIEESTGKPVPEKRLLKGTLADASAKTPLAFATVTLFALPDSTVVTGSITDELGGFTLLAKPGSYFLRGQFLSYQTIFQGNIQLAESGSTLDLGMILLQPNTKLLEEVVISAEKSQVQFGLDKQVFNVGKDLANKGGSAADILDNVPSVTVDVEGNVSLRGSENVRILIDGKPSGLVSFGSNGLSQLPANMIDRVEVITNPSARYEAEGMAGVINIVLKKEQKRGINGSFDLTVGQPDNYGAAININMRRDRFNFFSNYGVRYRKGPGGGTQYQEYNDGSQLLITDQISDRLRGGLSNNFRFGADYFLTPKDVFTTAFSWRYALNDNTSSILYRDFIGNLNNPDGSSRRTDNQIEKEPNMEYSLNYKKTFQREGHTLSADVQFQDNTENSKSDLLEQFFSADGNPSGLADLLQRSDNRESERNVITQLDYVHPFGQEGKFELGYRGGFRDIRNDYLVETFLDNNWSPLAGLSNNMVYTENIYAAYAILGNKVQKFSWQAGLRSELADVKTELLQTNEVNDRPLYTNFFPSAHVGYELPKENSLQISYSRRIRRPQFWDLNPFFTYSDSRNFWSGNPNLQPEYTDAYEIGHLKRWEKASLNTAIFYRHTTDVVERIRTQVSDTSAFTRPVNLATRNDYGLSFTGSYEPLPKWQINGNLNLFRSITEGAYEGQDFNADTYTWFGRISSRVDLWKKVNVQTTFNYRAPRKNPQGKEKAMYHADLGISTDILQNNGTLTFSVNDVFNTRKRRYITEGADFYTEGSFQWRARQATLTFSYRLNRQKEPERERDGDGGGEF